MTDKKLNCWEYMQCGREPGGKKAKELGVCPSAIVEQYNGINGGLNAGRCCWGIAGTLCEGQVQGTTASKVGNCFQCRFYQQVQQDERSSFIGIGLMDLFNHKAKPGN